MIAELKKGGNLPRRQRLGRFVLVSKIKKVFCVGSSVSLGGHTGGSACIKVVLWNLDGFLEGEGVFYESSDETRDNVPLNVTMKQPDT
jgi:hypothetical protein